MDPRVERYPKIRISVRPGDGLKALIEKAPRAEAAAERAARWAQPGMGWLYSLRRRLGTLAVGVITIWLFMHVMFGANGMIIYKQKRAEYKGLQKELDGLQKDNQMYTRQIQALKSDSQAIEKEAREQLHYVRPGEVVYVSPTASAAQNPEVNSARK